MSLWSESADIISALASNDAWEIREALKSDAAWYVGTLAAGLGGLAIMGLYRLVPFIERHLERTIMVVSYLAIAFIIFWGVVDRFVFSSQEPWSTTIPPLLFMVMAWFGASYNVRLRTHLSFSEFRSRMPRGRPVLLPLPRQCAVVHLRGDRLCDDLPGGRALGLELSDRSGH